MQRTQIYLDENLILELKEIAKSLNISMSEFIRQSLKKELRKYHKKGLSEFLDKFEALESFKDIDAREYVDDIRAKSRILEGSLE